MTVYYSIDEALNNIKVPSDWVKNLLSGLNVFKFFGKRITKLIESKGRSVLLAFDGYLGVEWKCIIQRFQEELSNRNLRPWVIKFDEYYKSSSEIEQIITPYLERDPHFGFVFKKGKIIDFLDYKKLMSLREELKKYKRRRETPIVVICYGSGSALPFLRNLYDEILYFDITREKLFNEVEKNPVPLGSREKISFNQFVKRFYYVDSQVLDKHKKYVLKYMHWYVESNDPLELKLLPKDIYYEILSRVTERPFAIKPLYYPVTWGGNWLKKVKGLPESMVNSGQGCIVATENAVRIAVNHIVLEIPFLNFLWAEPQKILGEYVCSKFKGNFPIKYWYDDTIEGWHMAIQVHAGRTYMKKCFNEPFPQDESYYIVFTYPGGKTYLGLKDDANIEEFRLKAIKAEKEFVHFDHEKYVNSITTKPGDYLLIPNGTVHASGRNQVVLEINGEISAYGPGYTFHIYDYLRPDLDGTLRPIHLEHSFNALRSNRRARWVSKNLKPSPRLVRSEDNGAEYLLGTYKSMYYEVRQLEFTSQISDDTRGRFHGLTLVEGESIIVQSEKYDTKIKLNFLDTVIVPACVGKYALINQSSRLAKVVKVLVK